MVAVLMHTCDAYAFAWDGFFTCWSRHINWPGIDKYVATEHAVPQGAAQHGWQHIETGTGNWSQRLLVALDRLKKYDQVFYLQEDYWPTGSIPVSDIYTASALMDQRGIKCVHFAPDSEYYTLQKAKPIGHHGIWLCYGSRIRYFAPYSLYLHNHQPGLWHRKFFMEQLNYNEDPWQNEKQGTRRLHSQHMDQKIMIVIHKWFEHVCRKGTLLPIAKTLHP